MAEIVQMVSSYIDNVLDQVATEIHRDLYAAVRDHNKSGAALASIKKEKLNSSSYFIGAHAKPDPTGKDGGMHVKWLDEGNGGSGSRIYPTRKKALNTPYGPKRSVKAHGGYGFIKDIAAKYRAMYG